LGILVWPVSIRAACSGEWNYQLSRSDIGRCYINQKIDDGKAVSPGELSWMNPGLLNDDGMAVSRSGIDLEDLTLETDSEMTRFH